jgi:hypothetical protein
MIKTKKLEIPKEQLKNLPIFYDFVLYNKLIPGDPFYWTRYSDKYKGLIHFFPPERFVSKIVDFSKE